MRDRRVALLRGINLGKAKRVAMADLRALVEGLGYRDVRTWLNSGNVVFTVPEEMEGDDPAAGIRAAMERELGIAALVVVLRGSEVAAAAGAHPLEDVADDPARLLVSVPATPEGVGRLAPLEGEDWAPEALAVGERVAWLWCPEGIRESGLAAAVERALDGEVTARNWNTMTRLAAMVGE